VITKALRTTTVRSRPSHRPEGSTALLLVLCVLLAGCGGSDSFFESTATTNGSTADGPIVAAFTPDPVVGDEPYIWFRVEGSTDVFADGETYRLTEEGIAAGDLGYVVVGYEVEEYPGPGTYRNAGCVVWFSSDGYEWARLGYSGRSGKNWMHSVVAGGPGFVAVGETSMGEADPAAWTSESGSSWSQSWTTSGGGDQQVHAIALGGPGFVAVGESYPGDAAVWVSRDGMSWDRVDDAAFSGPGALEMYDVVAGGPGLVAVGLEETADGYDGVVWTSRTGTDWSRVADPDGVFGGPGSQQIHAVVAGGPALVAFGIEEYALEVVWTSVDGITWTREPPGSIEFRGPGGNFVEIATGPAGPAAFWDGAIWLAVPCSASDDVVAATADSAGGEIDDSACTAARVDERSE
jgi:hypothetical protein